MIEIKISGNTPIVINELENKFDEVEKVKIRQHFEKTWLPLCKDIQRRT